MEFWNFSLLENGGPMMWALLCLSILGFIFFIERTLYLHRGQIRSNAFLDGIKNLLRKRRVIEAITVCEETPGPIPKVVVAALRNYNRTEPQLRAAMREAALVEIPVLERRVGTIAAIAKVSPLLGLLGTVIAMLTGFYKMQASGAYADASLFSGQVAQALISTAAGLAISAMAYLAHHFLYGRVRALVHDMEWVANDIMQFLLRELPETESTEETDPLQTEPQNA